VGFASTKSGQAMAWPNWPVLMPLYMVCRTIPHNFPQTTRNQPYWHTGFNTNTYMQNITSTPVTLTLYITHNYAIPLYVHTYECKCYDLYEFEHANFKKFVTNFNLGSFLMKICVHAFIGVGCITYLKYFHVTFYIFQFSYTHIHM